MSMPAKLCSSLQAAAAPAPYPLAGGQIKSPTAVRPCVQLGAGACSATASVCWQGEERRKAEETLHWPCEK